MRIKSVFGFLVLAGLTLSSVSAYAIVPECEIGQPGIVDLQDQIECAVQKSLEWLAVRIPTVVGLSTLYTSHGV